MLNPTAKVPFALVVSGVLMLAACGGAESAWDENDSERSVAESEQAAVDATEDAADEAAAEADAPAPSAPAPTPRTSTPPAAQAPPQQTSAPAPREVAAIPEGTSVSLNMESTLSTQTSQVGDVFFATVSEEVLSSDGMVLVPSGARVRGYVTESSGTTNADEEAVLGISLEALLMDGQEYPIHSTVVQTAIETDAADTNTRTATKVATGAAAGAVIGQILGRDTRSTVQGAAAGAVAGTAVALATREGHSVLREGSLIVIRLDSRVPLVAQR